MDLTGLVGTEMTIEKRVMPSMTASHVGSGGVDVLATPTMILLFEQTARDSIQNRLPEGFTTVGVRVDIEHVSATPGGEIVTVSTEVVSVSGRMIEYRVEAHDEHHRIGGGTHRRCVVNLKNFIQRLASRSRTEGTGM